MKYTSFEITWEAVDAEGNTVDFELEESVGSLAEKLLDPSDPAKDILLNQEGSREFSKHLELNLMGDHLDMSSFATYEEVLKTLFLELNQGNTFCTSYTHVLLLYSKVL